MPPPRTVHRVTISKPLRLDYVDGRTWIVALPVTFRYAGPDITIDGVVPAGFQTDFASVPRFFWRVLPPTGEYGIAAVIHDWLYQSKSVSKREADLVFLAAMQELNVAGWKRKIMFNAVHWFGCHAYSAQRRDLMKIDG